MRSFDYGKLANRLWDNDILLLCSKVHECKGRQDLLVVQKPAQLKRLIEIAKIQSTESSNRIEGIVSTSSRIKKLMADKTTPKNRDEMEIVGYRDVLETIHENHEYIDINPNHILQLHRDLMRPSKKTYAGQFKNVQNYIKEITYDGEEIVRFIPLDPFETPMAIEEMCRSYNEAMAREIVNPLILISAFVCDFLCVHPFNDGNGRMSRLLTLLLMYKCGYNVGKYISIENQIEKTKDAYYDSLQVSGYGWHDEENDPTPFIRYMLQMILACYAKFEERVGDIEEDGVRSSTYDIVRNYVTNRIGRFTASDVMIDCPGAGRTSVFNALKKLQEEGVIEKHGERQQAFYIRK